MIIKKLLFIILFIPLLQTTPATAQNYKGVQELMFVDKLPLDNFYNISIVVQRCAGLYGAYAKFLPSDMPEKEKLFNLSMKMLTKSIVYLAKARGSEMDAVMEEVDQAFNVYLDIYYKNLEENKILTGSMFGEFFNGEEEVCSNVTKIIEVTK
jgi:hypothetical protein